MENSFLQVLMCQDKKELKQLCKALTVEKSDFIDVIIACKAGVAHLNHTMHYFDYVPEHLETRETEHPLREWHMVFFEMNELRDKNNHWCGGSHVHITNHLWPKLYCQDLWNDFLSTRAFPSTKLHLAFNDELRRSRA